MKVTIRITIAIFTLSGILHLVNPQAFMWLMPPWLPQPTLLIYLSGLAELASAVGLLLNKGWGGYLSVLTLLAIWPANIWYAFDSLNSQNIGLMTLAWIRLPFQIPLIYFSWKFARSKVSN